MENRPSLKRAFALAVVLVAVGAFGAAMSREASSDTLPTIYINYVGTNCTFTATNDSNANVTSLAPGTYQLRLAAQDFVSCGSSLPDFQLLGPNVDVETSIDVGGSGSNFTIVLKPSSTYVAQDLNQPASKLTFTTTATGTPQSVSLPTTTLTSTGSTGGSSSPIGSKNKVKKASTTFRGTLAGTVSASGALKLTYKGKVVTTLVTGKYTLVVADHSKTGGFVLQEPPKGAKTVTTGAFVGKKTATVELTAGQAVFYPSIIGKKNYFIVRTAS